ncbi:MAG: sulfotransferase [Bacteroidota bacterium]
MSAESLVPHEAPPDLWEEASSCAGEEVVFIVGSPRSGTTWLQRLLASHPQVRTGQESHLFSHYLAPQLRTWQRAIDRTSDPAFEGRSGLGLAGYLEEAEFLNLLRLYVVMMMRAAGMRQGDRFLEKSPSHALVIPEIRTLLPRSKFIHLVRDPRDVVASLVAASQGWGKAWAPSDTGKAAGIWVKHVEAVREASGQMPAGTFVQVRYEDLSADPEGTLRSLTDFMGLAWSADQVSHAVEANRVGALKGGGGTPIPIFGHYQRVQGDTAVEPEGFVRKAKPGTGRKELSLGDKKRIRDEVYPTMKTFGYAWKLTDWV